VETTTARDGTVLAYRVQGDGPLTLLLHGGFLDSRAWLGLMPLLTQERTVVAPDRRGHGESGRYGDHHRLDDDVDDLAVLARELDPAGRGIELFAHSAGGHVALAAACAGIPISRLVMYEPPAIGDPPITDAVWKQMDDAVDADDRERLVILALNEVVGASTGERIPPPAFSSIFQTPFGQMLLDNALSIPVELRAQEDHSWHETSLESMTIPILLLVGADSPPFNRRFADWVANVAPSAQVSELAHATHGTPMEDPARVASILLANSR
jgi:pimeloyl-ACP methyl ester carboxylesterase